jgi:hypothetical protein
MECHDIQAHLPDHLAGALPPDDMDAVASHLRTCAACAAEFEGLDETWQRLGELRGHRPDSAGMRARFEAGLEAQQHGAARSRRPSARSYGLQLAAAAALLIVGVLVGRAMTPAAPADPQIADLRADLREMRQMVALSLLQQQSPSDRLKGVTWTRQIEQGDSDVITALLDTLRYDSNVNVRLAAVDALKRFAGDAAVRRGAADALVQQTSPLVQIALIDFIVEIGDRDAAATLRRLSMDPMAEKEVRARAAQGLARVEA